MSPRSILKRSSDRSTVQQHQQQHAVHFPPTTSLCSTYSAYSPALYDRSPIVVSKNVCALPERGGRTYILDDTPCPRTPPHPQTSRSYHPRAMNDDRRAGLPQLIPDISSSESDESDAFNHSPSVLYGHPSGHYYSYGANGLPRKYDYESPVYTHCDNSHNDIDAISFLPYPPSPPGHSDRSRRRQRHNDGAHDLDRIRAANNSSSSTSSLEDARVSPPPSKKRSSSRRREYLSKLAQGGSTAGLCGSFGAVSLQDDGCLGGF